MNSKVLFEKSGFKIAVYGELNADEFEILQEEVNTTISGILKFRKFGGGSRQNFLKKSMEIVEKEF